MKQRRWMQLIEQLPKKIMKHYKIKAFILLILTIVLTNTVLSKTIDEIIEGKKRAVILITVRDKNNPSNPGIGSGFFTDNKGHFVTNKHILDEYLADQKNTLVEFENIKGEKFTNVEIERCGNENNIDLCYGKITTDKKLYFFDVIDRTANKSQEFAIIGQNGDYFSVKKGEVIKQEIDVDAKFGVPLKDQENIHTSMIQLGKYEYKSGSCKGDSGSPVFDSYTGDLFGVFTNCIGVKGETRNKYAIDSKAVYTYINSISNFSKIKIPKEHFYEGKRESGVDQKKEVEEVRPGKGEEFDMEKKTGKLE
jgi:V8-like Glu-specific endopeptidase